MNKKEATALLFKAAETGNAADVLAALDAGAVVNARNNNQETPLHRAAWYGRDEEIAALLIASGADVNAMDSAGRTALDCATENKHNQAIGLLQLVTLKQGHAGRVAGERKDNGPRKIGD